MSCSRSLLTLDDKLVMKFKCSDCAGGASVEKSERCMRGVIRGIMENPDIDSVVLSGIYEREYVGPGLDALKEIARIISESSCWSFAELTPEGCVRCKPIWKKRMKRAFEVVAGDPAAGLREFKEFLREMSERAKRGAKKCRACRSSLVKKVLEPVVHQLENSSLLRGHHGRRDYGKILQPKVRPRFLSSRVKLEPPPNSELVSSYEVQGCGVRIYRLSGGLQNYYFLLPPEYHLPREHAELIQRAWRLMVERAPYLDVNPLRARKQVAQVVKHTMANLVDEHGFRISPPELGRLAEHLARYTAGLGVIEILLADEKVQDIYVDAPVGTTPVHIYHRDYEECLTNIFLTPDEAESLISRFRAVSGRPFSEADPVLDLNLGEVRITAVGRPLSPGGPAFALRRHKPTPWTLPQFIRVKFLSPYAAGLLSLLVDAQLSILVTGSRGSGKTSLLGALMLELLPKFRVLTLEDTLELPVEHLRRLGFKVQSLCVQPVVSAGNIELKAEDALRVALRLGESVLVVGEVRGEDARTLYEAMRVGAAGNSVMGTIHGATPREVFERVVHDLGISPSSFKATDVIVTAAPIRVRGSANRTRRLVQITGVKKDWCRDPTLEGGFESLMYYDRMADELRPARILREQRATLIEEIARKWGVGPREVMCNLEFRAKVQRTIVETAERLQSPELLEADFVVPSNLVWHALFEAQLREGKLNYNRLFRDWREWFHSTAERVI